MITDSMKSGIIPLLTKLPEFLLVMGLCAPFSLHAERDRPWPIITFTCDKSKNEVKLKNEVKWGDAGKNFQFNALQGTYNPWELVSHEDRAKRQLLSEKAQYKFSCQLGDSKYRFIIRPKIFNTNFKAKCGDRLSVKVSIYKDDALLLLDKTMEGFCVGNAPVLKGIKIKGGSSKIKFYEVPRSRFY